MNNLMNEWVIEEIETLEELKRRYKRLSLVFHPDRVGGDHDKMVRLNNEYEYLFNKFKNIHKNADGQIYEKETDETPQEFQDLVNELLKLKTKGMLIEIIGSFVWCYGNTKPIKEDLKNMGFRWSKNKQAWYLAPKGYKKKSKKTYDFNELRATFGSSVVKDKNIINAIE